MPFNVLITGLEERLSAELSRTMAELHLAVTSEPYSTAEDCLKAIDRTAADLVFCTAEREAYEGLLWFLRRMGRRVPVVVVSELPEVDNWLDALDAGAHDYCAAPFEPRMMRNIIESALNTPREAALAV